MLDNLFFGGEVEDFMKKTDEMIDKVEDWKNNPKHKVFRETIGDVNIPQEYRQPANEFINMFQNDEKSQYQVMGKDAKVEDVNNEF